MIKVLIVDDQELFRESLKVVLSVNGNIQVADAVPGVAQALKSAAQRATPHKDNNKITVQSMTKARQSRLIAAL